MSFLNSIMSSIGGEESSKSTPTTTASKSGSLAPKRVAPPNSDAKPQASGGATSLKRKAEDASATSQSKTPRLVPGTTLVPPLSRSTTSSPIQKTGTQPPKPQGYQGTMKNRTAATSSAPVASKQSISQASQTSAASTPSTAKPAAKGGYLAMLERAKAAQESAKPLGLIKHHKTEKISRKERERLQAEAAAEAKKGKAAAGRVSKAGDRSRDTTPATGKAGAVQKEKKPVEVGYKGTMRPVSNQPAYRGTVQSGKSKANTKYGGSRSGGRDNGYARWSDEEEMMEDDDVDEEEDDIDSASSDMEAGMDEIDREEFTSAKIARTEDEEALRLENELKRQKLERKKKLEQLQAAAAKKRKLY